MPPKYNYKKAFFGANNQARLKSAAKAYAGKNAERKRRNTVGIVRRAVNAYGPTIAKALTGMGGYQLADPVSLGSRHYVGRAIEQGTMGIKHTSHHGQHPKIKMEKGMMSILHSEYIGDLISSSTTGSSNFVSQSYAINPGNTGTFPWLSSTAINFQHYRFKKLVFEYRPLVSESSSSTAATLLSMGSVIAATQYNSTVGPYTTKQQMAESDFAVTVKPSEHLLHAVECDPKFNPLGELYVSAQASLTVGANSSDIRMQNLGIFEMASCNVPIASSTAVDLGEIWVHYEVELYKPQINAYLSGLQTAHYYGDSATASPATTQPFGTGVTAGVQPLATANNLLSLSFASNGHDFSFPLQVTSGCFFCLYWCKGTLALNASTAPTVTNGTLVMNGNNGTLGTEIVPLAWEQAGSTAATNGGATTVSSYALWFIVQVNAPGASLCTVTLTTSVVPTTSGWDLYVTPYNFLMA